MKSSPPYIMRLFTGGLSRCSLSLTHSTKLKTGGTATALLLSESAAMRDGLDLDQQVRMRELVHRHGGAGGSRVGEELSPDLVGADEGVHGDAVRLLLPQVAAVGAVAAQDRTNVLQDGAGLHADVQ